MTTPPEPPKNPPGDGGEPPERFCPGTSKKRGVRCIYELKPGETHCYNHDPAREAERKAAGAIRRQPGDPGTPLGTYDGIARRAAKVLEDLEAFSEVEDEDGDVVYLRHLEPAVANAQLNALRFLAVMVRIRSEGKSKPNESLPNITNVEDLVG